MLRNLYTISSGEKMVQCKQETNQIMLCSGTQSTFGTESIYPYVEKVEFSVAKHLLLQRAGPRTMALPSIFLVLEKEWCFFFILQGLYGGIPWLLLTLSCKFLTLGKKLDSFLYLRTLGKAWNQVCLHRIFGYSLWNWKIYLCSESSTDEFCLDANKILHL